MNPAAAAAALRKAVGREPLWLEARGGSMGPRVGARVLVVPGETPRRGDVWAFCAEDAAVIVHRCVARRTDGWVFRGDARAGADPLVPREHLVGRATHFEDRTGALRRFGGRERAAGALRRAYLTTRRVAGRAARRAGLRRVGAIR